ncbi:MAG TPA: glycosyltransferase family 39 protein [Vicinamibacterales bacterium]|nr:glycosyltransferase family 39 protein [Vicinamibacterales bacterium]
MRVSRWLIVVCVIAALHGAAFIVYQRPDWMTEWSDQDGYRRLGESLARTGKFTRFPDAATFVPEVIRTPAYPIFVAAIYKVAGASQTAVALAQTALFILICLLVFAITRTIAGDGIALGAAALTALFPPIPYFGALVMTEVWTTFLFTVGVWLTLRGWRDRSPWTFAALGFVLAATALSRPAFVLFPCALIAVGGIETLAGGRAPRLVHWATMLAAFAITLAPWLAYNYVNLGRITLSPAGGIGRGLWEGSWQATWPGRIQNELTHLADDIEDRGELDAQVRAVAAREHVDPGPMLEYVHQWEDIRDIWTKPTDPVQRAAARVAADQEYGRVAIANVRSDSIAHLVKRLARGVFVLWAGDIPIRYSRINLTPAIVIRFFWAVQAVLVAASIAGLVALARGGRGVEALLLAAPLVYITAVHFPLLTEARQSLPAKPVVLLLAALAIGHAFARSLAGKAQVHERQHL